MLLQQCRRLMLWIVCWCVAHILRVSTIDVIFAGVNPKHLDLLCNTQSLNNLITQLTQTTCKSNLGTCITCKKKPSWKQKQKTPTNGEQRRDWNTNAGVWLWSKREDDGKFVTVNECLFRRREMFGCLTMTMANQFWNGVVCWLCQRWWGVVDKGSLPCTV